MNFGRLSEHLKYSFPDLIPANKPIRLNTELLNQLDPHFILQRGGKSRVYIRRGLF